MSNEELLELADRLSPQDHPEGPNFLFQHTVTDAGDFLIRADQQGLKMLASQILRLSARDYVAGMHQDFEVFAPSDEGSDRMTIQRVEGGLSE
ncbi:Imm32 family immunity protein [Aurantiacibacter sp. D1-12]|uniref:Imm32 family immunity protein n=1 Tax=Aurantiacibacter sp. D1-12 TaxID=2993658 RepID=UPI00237CE52C|nr:hypothetical protein [Aurantiacibacter sp. D1-12]MDE1467536.1 hypothetical protein [Aurantiacibacter sp. D1-12]